MNPSPGNIRDGLITDAMKSAGGAKKGGRSPATSVLDYLEPATVPGLNLQCTPGNDVECVTAPGGRRRFWTLRGSPGHSGCSTAHGLLFMLSSTAV
jgi:altronate dehydratase